MADEDIELPDRGYTTEDVRAVRDDEPPKKKGRRWGLILLGVLVVVPALLLGLWSWITLSYTYSSGERAGYVQKLSRKGWLCKTWEGELAMANLPGAMPEVFAFTVRDDAVADRINATMGQRVSLHYEEHRGVPTSCFGETNHFVTDVRQVEGTPGAAPSTLPPGSAPPTVPGTPPAAPPGTAAPAPATTTPAGPSAAPPPRP